MKILHTSDIHLDSAMHGDPEKAKIRRAELLTAFSRLVDYAKKEGADAVIIAGDLFDRGKITSKVRRFVIDTIKSCEDVQFFVLFGNHDAGCFSFFDELPKNVKVFTSGWEYFDLGEVVICGIELNGENCEKLYGELALDPSRVNIAVMHGAISSVCGEDNINLKLLEDKGIDYLALGHYHSYSEGALDRRGKYAYCGCLEGRGFDECGEKGFCVLDIDGGVIKTRFVKNSVREIVEVEATFELGDSFTEQKEKILAALEGVDRSSVVRVRVGGKMRPSDTKFFDQIKSELDGVWFSFDIKDKTEILIDRADYAGDVSLKGEFVRLVASKVKNTEEQNKIIACGLAALMGGELE